MLARLSGSGASLRGPAEGDFGGRGVGLRGPSGIAAGPGCRGHRERATTLDMTKREKLETVTVDLGERSYPICIGTGILPGLGERLKQLGVGRRVALLTNPVVAAFYRDAVVRSLESAGFEAAVIEVPDGEEHKNLAWLTFLYDRLLDARMERGSAIVALGGGVIGDLAGFTAATFLRGVPFVQVPTTLLAQVDSSVGGKTAVNHDDGKNLIGAFYQPKLVLIDIAVLRSLPRRELIAGLAEVIKYGIIEDAALFSMLEQSIDKIIGLNQEMLTRIIAASCSIKARVVEADEREDDYRAVLNFGHTIGHALEAATGYRKFLHGEAVGVGMVKAAALSVNQRFCDAASLKRVMALIQKAGLPVEIPPEVAPQSLIQAMEIDKKVAGGKIKFIMCEGIGKTRFHWLAPDEILRGLGA
jgi:3-dehydroquinate synthase